MNLILTTVDKDWNFKIERSTECPPYKPRTLESCVVTIGKDYEGTVRIYIPKPDLHLCALAVEYYASLVYDEYGVVWQGMFDGGIGYDSNLTIWMDAVPDTTYDRMWCNPHNLYIGFTSTHAKTPNDWIPYPVSSWHLKFKDEKETIEHKEQDVNVQNTGLKFDEAAKWGFWIEDRTGNLKLFKLTEV